MTPLPPPFRLFDQCYLWITREVLIYNVLNIDDLKNNELPQTYIRDPCLTMSVCVCELGGGGGGSRDTSVSMKLPFNLKYVKDLNTMLLYLTVVLCFVTKIYSYQKSEYTSL